MPRFNVRLSGLRVDTGRFTKAFDEKADILMREAARAWLRAVLIKVPVWTGFAQGSIVFADGPGGNLSRFLRVAIPGSFKQTIPKWYYHPGRGRVLKTPENAGKFSHYTMTNTRRVYTFTFTSNVVHYLIEEFFHRVSWSSPWNSMEAGKEAWLAYFDAHIGNLPHISDFNIPVPVIELKNSQLTIRREAGFNA